MNGRPKFEAVAVCLDAEDNPLWETYGIEIVPSVLVFEHGEVVRRFDGEPRVGLDVRDLEQGIAELDRG